MIAPAAHAVPVHSSVQNVPRTTAEAMTTADEYNIVSRAAEPLAPLMYTTVAGESLGLATAAGSWRKIRVRVVDLVGAK